jgi:CheY-like chemotaxis protein
LITLQTSNKAITQALQLSPDVIILAEMDGYQVLSALQADVRLRAILVIALTANALKEDMERGLAAGFSFYLTKSVDKQELIGAIARRLLLE